MTEPDPTVRGQELGEELRKLRDAAGMSLQDASRKFDASASKLSRLETGRRTAPIEDIATLLAVYGVTGDRRCELLDLARGAERRGWWQRNRPDFTERHRTLVSLEARADAIVDFEDAVIPGLLQTGEHTRAIMTESEMVPEDDIENRMVARLHRHAVLSQRNPPQLCTLIDELVLHRFVGGADVLRRQLEYLMEASARTNITIRVVPNEGRAHAGLDGPFILVRRSGMSPVVFLDNLTSSLFIEDRAETARYETALRSLLERALDERQSAQLIADRARYLDKEASFR